MAREIVHPQVVAVIAAALARYGEVSGKSYRLVDVAAVDEPARGPVAAGAWRQSARLEPQFARAAFYGRSAGRRGS